MLLFFHRTAVDEDARRSASRGIEPVLHRFIHPLRAPFLEVVDLLITSGEI
jgi:hypothetical protein